MCLKAMMRFLKKINRALNQVWTRLLEMNFAFCTKGHLFMFFGMIVLIGLMMIHNSHNSHNNSHNSHNFQLLQLELQEEQKKLNHCKQEQESLSSQQQVIFEHSLSLEKFLRQAKADHRQAKAELQARVDQEKKLRKEINLKSVDKYMSLLKQYRLLQSQHEELTNECNTLRLTQLKGLEVKRKLESAVQTVRQELELLYVAKEKEMQSLKSHSLRLEGENDRLQKQNMELATHVQDLANHPNLLEKNINQCNHKITELKKSLMRCQIDLNRHAELKTVKVSKRPATKEKGKVQNIPSPSPSPIAVIPEEVNVQDSKEKSKQGASGKVPSSSPNPVAFSLSFTAFQDVNFEQLQSKTDQMLNKSLQNSHLQQAK